MRRQTGLIALDELAGLAKKMPTLQFFCQKSQIDQMDLPAKYGEPSSMGTS